MKKVSLLILVSLVLLLAFTSCDSLAGQIEDLKVHVGLHKEHTWTDATCTTPKTCTVCGGTEGEALGHDWADATCTLPKTCKTCDATEGEPAGHNWTAANCTDPRTCASCGLKDGKALGHKMADATCVDPATCEVCGHTEGEALGHKFSEGTCQSPSLCTTCGEANPDKTVKHLDVTHFDMIVARCHYEGNFEYWHCNDCDKYALDEAFTMFTTADRVGLPVLGSDKVVHFEAIAPACHYNGNVEYWFCPECEKVWTDASLSDQYLSNLKNVIVPAEGGEVEHVEARPSRCHDEGNIEYWFCEKCEQFWVDAALTQITNSNSIWLPALGGEVTHVEAVAPTCHKNGNYEYWYCEECDKVWADAELKILSNHRNTIHAYDPDNVDYYAEVPATCTENGMSEFWYCKVCDTFYGEPELTHPVAYLSFTITALGHNMAPATCTAPSTCTRCNEYTEGEKLSSHTLKSNYFDHVLSYGCETCDLEFVVDQKVYFDGTTEDKFFYASNGNMPVEVVDGAYSAIFNPSTAAPESSEGLSDGQVVGDWAWYHGFGAQHMFWIPSRENGKGLQGFSCENNAVGVVSFKMKTSATSAFTVAVAKERGASDWTNWDGSQIELMRVGGTVVEDAAVEAITLTNVFGTDYVLTTVPVVDGWAEFTLDIVIGLTAEKKMTVAYYVDGKFCNTTTGDMTTDSGDIRALYINGWTYAVGTGIVLDDIAFGYTANGQYFANDHVHTWVDATCETPKTCPLCGLTEGEKLGHINSEVKFENVVEATCTSSGSHDEVIYCTREDCGIELQRESKVDAALGHNSDVVIPGTPADCENTGLTDGAKCSRCGETQTAQSVIPALGHVDEDPKDDICDRCEADLSCKHIDTEKKVVPGKAPTCTDDGLTDGEMCVACGKMSVAQEAIPALGHKAAEAVREHAVAPTCTTDGKYDSVVYCEHGCGTELSREKDVKDPALGHDEIAHEAQAPDCTNVGWEAYVTCSRCDYTTKVEIAALGHTLDTAATCVSPAKCSVCGEDVGDPNPNAHKYERSIADGKLLYVCALCDNTHTVSTKYIYHDASKVDADGKPVNDISSFLHKNGNMALIVEDGVYKVYNTDDSSYADAGNQHMLFTNYSPAADYGMFSCATNATGALSFRMQTNVTSAFTVVLCKPRNSADWTGWNTSDINILAIGASTPNGVEIKGGLDANASFTTISVGDDGWSEWFDVKIFIELDDGKNITVSYYINDTYYGTYTRDMANPQGKKTIDTYDIGSVYINGYTKGKDTGYRFDDFAFGYTAYPTSHNFESKVVDGQLVFGCKDCNAVYNTGNYYHTDGTHMNGFPFTNNMGAFFNKDLFEEGQNQGYPYMGNGYFEYVKNDAADGIKQLQLWIPKYAAGFTGFDSANNAVGLISFDINSYIDSEFNIQLIEFAEGTDKWAADGGITKHVLRIVPRTINGELHYDIIGWGGTLLTVKAGEDKYTGWMNITIGLKLDAKSDSATAFYYINGNFIGRGVHTLTQKNNGISSVYFNANTTATGSGYKLDNIVFAFEANGHNIFDGGVHNVTSATCRDAETCSCGYVGKTLPHKIDRVDGDIVCTVCEAKFIIDNGVSYDGTTEDEFYYASNGKMPTVNNNGVYETIFNPGTDMPTEDQIPLDGEGKPKAGALVGETGWAWNNGFGAQHMFWIPGKYAGDGVQGFNCDNNSVGILSFKMQTNVTKEFYVSLAKERENKEEWTGWGTSELKVLYVGGYSENGIVLKGGIGAGTTLTTIGVKDGWSEWFQVDILIQLRDDHTVELHYYINGEYVKSFYGAMTIDSGVFKAIYINGWTYAANTGIKLDDIVFGCATKPNYFYNSVVDAADVKSETLKTLVNGKIKQFDQSTVINTDGGTPVYVLADKDGAQVEALYFSRTSAWGTGTSNKEEFSEFRFAVNGEQKGFYASSISFDYKINGSVEENPGDHIYEGDTIVKKGYTFTDLKGNKFVADSYVQVKTTSNHPLAGDNYPELSGTEFVFDGEWHTMSYTFDEPLEIIDVLVCLYHFQGELLIANLQVNEAFYISEVKAEDVQSETLKTLVNSKIKQFDQSTVINTDGGTPVYVHALKDGAQVEALYFSRTSAWGTGTSNKEEFAEFRFAVNGEKAGPAAKKISFDYKVNGTVEENPGDHIYEGDTIVKKGYTFADLKGNKFVADSYVQVKTPANHPLAGDNYPELSGTDLIMDGEWHTMTYTFDEPLVIIDILLCMYHFQGEMLISNLVIEYAE